MKVIFLDIDGVLNCETSKSRCDDWLGIDNSRVKLLRQIVETTNANIVLCSSWKHGYSRNPEICKHHGKYMKNKLQKEKLSILSVTVDPHNNDLLRGHGIQDWLSNHPEVDKWIVIDDEVFDDYHECNIIPHLVKTDFKTNGLNEELTREAINMLNEV